MQSFYKLFHAHQDNKMSKLDNLKYDRLSQVFENIEEVVHEALRQINKSRPPQSKTTVLDDVHYSTMLYEVGADHPVRINTLVFDLDCIDSDQSDKYIEVFAKVVGIPANQIGVISSGGGLHFWLELSTPIKATDKNFYSQYKSMCASLDKALSCEGLIDVKRIGGKKKITNFDAHCFDRHKTLRLPNTINTKYDPPRPCVIINFAKTEVDFTNLLERVEENTTKLLTEKGILYNRPTLGEVDSFAVKQGCKFLQHYTNHQDEQTYQSWHAMGLIYLNLASQDPEKDEHDFYEASCNYPNFNEVDFARKVDSIRSSGHSSYGCEKINSMWGGCPTCPHFNKVRNPLQIQGDSFIASEKDGFWLQVGTDAKPKYIVDNEGLWKKYQQSNRVVFNSKDNITLVLDKEKGLWELKTDRGLAYIKEDLKLFAHKHIKIPYSKGEINKEKNTFADYVIHSKCSITKELLEESRFIQGCLTFNNGIYNYSTGEKVGDENSHFITTKLPYDYDAKAEVPKVWLKFLDTIFQGNQNLIDQLGFVFADVLSRDTRFQIFHYWFGVGGTGKSTVADVLKALVGSDNTSTINAENFRSEEKLFPLVDSFVNIQNEVNFNKMPDIIKDALKNLSAGGEFSHRKLYSNPMKAVNRCRLLFTSNEPFHLKNDDRALLRRLRVLPFNYAIPEHATDGKILDKLTDKKVLAGIMNWSIGYLKRLNDMQVFPNPPECKDLVQDFQNQANPINLFLDSHYIMKPKDLNGSIDKLMCLRSDLFFIFKIMSRSMGFKYIDAQYKQPTKFLEELNKVYKAKTGICLKVTVKDGEYVVRGICFNFALFENDTDLIMSSEEFQRFNKCKRWYNSRAEKIVPFTAGYTNDIKGFEERLKVNEVENELDF